MTLPFQRIYFYYMYSRKTGNYVRLLGVPIEIMKTFPRLHIPMAIVVLFCLKASAFHRISEHKH